MRGALIGGGLMIGLAVLGVALIVAANIGFDIKL